MARKAKKRVSRKRVLRRRRRALGSLGQTPVAAPSRAVRDRQVLADYIQEALDWKADTVSFAAIRDCDTALGAHSSARRALGMVVSRARSNEAKKAVEDLTNEIMLGQMAVTLCYQNQPVSRIRRLDVRTTLPEYKY